MICLRFEHLDREMNTIRSLNFPAQFKHLAPRLIECGHDVRVLRFGAGRDKNLSSIKEYSCTSTTLEIQRRTLG